MWIATDLPAFRGLLHFPVFRVIIHSSANILDAPCAHCIVFCVMGVRSKKKNDRLNNDLAAGGERTVFLAATRPRDL